MRVRCGNCRSELEVAGAGEFLCPRCGTRNVVRGAPPADPFALYPDLGAGAPGAPPPPPPPQQQQDPGVRWIDCPSCSYRFVVGVDLAEVSCPNCSTSLALDASGPRVAG